MNDKGELQGYQWRPKHMYAVIKCVKSWFYGVQNVSWVWFLLLLIRAVNIAVRNDVESNR